MMARIRASAIGFAKAWERAVSFQSRTTSPEDGARAEAVAGDATASTSTVAQPVKRRCMVVIVVLSQRRAT